MKRCQFLHHRFMLVSFLLLSLIPGILSVRLVTLDSIEIFNTHEWFPSKPTVYFSCKGENKTILPDVKQSDVLYTFKGKESWQPLVELPEQKCKRCGIYEMDTYKSDDVFDEWEMCSDDFINGKYEHFKQGEFNATFLCPDCVGSGSAVHNSTAVPQHEEGKSENNSKMIIIVIFSVLGSILVIFVSVFAYKYWLRRKREQDQLRFLKLFEEGDEIEDEITLGHVI
ncbi:hypothetical protein LUZ60_013010 [Juncus effusus]|nr:hypothetical protein LUZ60_013010 [Juncus effusus]